jgi:hypothetical protein
MLTNLLENMKGIDHLLGLDKHENSIEVCLK